MTEVKDATPEARLSLARYAEALAYSRDYPAADHARVLGRLGVDGAEFDRACVAWPEVLQRELARRDPTRMLAFAEAYCAAEHFARTVHPPVERIESRAVEPVASRAGVRARAMRKLPSRASVATTAGVHSPAKAQASYMKAEALDLGALAMAVPSATATALGPAGVSAPLPPHPPPPAPPSASIDVDATGMLDPRLLAEPILPFRATHPGAAPPASTPAAQSDAGRASWKPSSSPRGLVDPTEQLDAGAIARAITPFGSAPSITTTVDDAIPDAEETAMFVPAPGLLADAKREAAAAVESGPMTLERYATVSAQLADGDASEVLPRLGLDRPRWVQAMSDMAARFKAEPGLEDQYRTLMRERLGQVRGGKEGQ